MSGFGACARLIRDLTGCRSRAALSHNIGMDLESPRLACVDGVRKTRVPFAAMNAEPGVQRYLSPIPRESSDAMLDRIDAHFARYGWGFWAVEERGSGTLIGLCGLAHVRWKAFFTPAIEIGWRLSTAWQRKGLAREAAETALDFAFHSLRLSRVRELHGARQHCFLATYMERLGMRKIGEFDHPNLPEGDPLRLHVIYEIDASDARK